MNTAAAVLPLLLSVVQGDPWLGDLDVALAKARKTKRPVLVYVYDAY